MSRFVSRAANAADNTELQQLFSLPQPSHGMELAFERAPNYFASAAVMYQQSKLLLVRHQAEDKLAATVNMGHRDAYINGQRQLLRYGADMRIAPAYRGGRVLLYVNRAVKKEIRDGWYLTVILHDNQRSKSSLEGGRAGLPFYRPIGDISTHTITHATRKRPAMPSDRQIRTATQSDITAMNRWVEAMAAHYQFLPCYDFRQLQKDDAFYQGLCIDDFLLLERHGHIEGIIGLWDQATIKQTRVVHYGRAMQLVRPVYNAWIRLTGGLRLPATGGTFSYLSLHSPLTHPGDMSGFTQLLHAALERTTERKRDAMVITLSDKDPRQAALKQFKSQVMQATQYTVAYQEADQPELAADYIPFYDAGRL